MEFEYISAKEAANKIGVTVRWIQQLCKDGKVEGAKRFGTQDIWLVPIKWVEERIASGSETGKQQLYDYYQGKYNEAPYLFQEDQQVKSQSQKILRFSHLDAKKITNGSFTLKQDYHYLFYLGGQQNAGYLLQH